ncbi:MAG: hypothetical protein ACI9WS_002495 [Paraglaciecola psychrophila]|jgi:hypothetical protein
MTSAKKYQFKAVQNDSNWTGQIIRRVSARKTMVSKQQTGFATQEQANSWGEVELKAFLVKQNERNTRKSQ